MWWDFVSLGLRSRWAQTYGEKVCCDCGRISRLVSPLPHPCQHALPRENAPLCSLNSSPLPYSPVSRLVLGAHIFLLSRVGQQPAALVCFRKVLQRPISQSPLRNLHPPRLMGQNQSYIRLPPCKPCGRNPRQVPWVLQIPIPVPGQPTEK